MSFDQFNLNPVLLRILKEQGILEPTPVQAQAIPAAIEGRDVLAVSQTGTGKTFAFGLPALTKLEVKGQPWRNRMLVLTPTRELAHQIHTVLRPFADAMNLKSVCLYGGVGMEPQVRALRKGVSIVIATPGRLLDHMNRRNVKFDNLSTLVLDEADRMLDMGFLPDIKRILETMPEERQTMLFSATFAREIEDITHQFMRDPLRVKVAATTEPAKAVRQGRYTVRSEGKLDLLKSILAKPEVESAIVFMRAKVRTDRVRQALHKHGVKAEAIHGDRSQSQRQRAIDGFRKGRFQVLVATDVAARGLDVKGITHVVNYDIPGSFDDYIHRIGRTARANAEGDAITFVSPNEHKELYEIERKLGNAIPIYDWEGSVEMDAPTRGGGSKGRFGGKGKKPYKSRTQGGGYRGGARSESGGSRNNGGYRGASRNESGGERSDNGYRGESRKEAGGERVGGGYRGGSRNESQDSRKGGGYKPRGGEGQRGESRNDRGDSNRPQSGKPAGKSFSGKPGDKKQFGPRKGAAPGGAQGGAKFAKGKKKNFRPGGKGPSRPQAQG